MKLARSVAKKTMASAISSAVAGLPAGPCAASCSRPSPIASVPSVRVGPGLTAETVGALPETWLRRRAHRLEPATDVHLGMSFTAVMPGSGRIGGFRIPPAHSKLGISASNHEPVGGAGGHQSTDFTSKFLQGGAIRSFAVVACHLHSAIEA